MADFDTDTIKHLTQLSRIKCTDEEMQKLSKNLKDIIGYVAKLSEVDTENVQPCNHVLETMHNVMREDEVGEPLSRELFLANAPSHVGGMIRVPPVLKSY